MKTMTKIIAALALLLALSGCVTHPTQEQVTIQRHSIRSASAVLAAIERTATVRGFTKQADGSYQRILEKTKDPILGVVTVSDQAAFVLSFTVTTDQNEQGTLVRVLPCGISKGNPSYVFVRPGGKLHAEVLSLLDAAMAEASFAQSNR